MARLRSQPDPELRAYLAAELRAFVSYYGHLMNGQTRRAYAAQLHAIENSQPVSMNAFELPAGLVDHVPPDAIVEIDHEDQLWVSGG